MDEIKLGVRKRTSEPVIQFKVGDSVRLAGDTRGTIVKLFEDLYENSTRLALISVEYGNWPNLPHGTSLYDELLYELVYYNKFALLPTSILYLVTEENSSLKYIEPTIYDFDPTANQAAGELVKLDEYEYPYFLKGK